MELPGQVQVGGKESLLWVPSSPGSLQLLSKCCLSCWSWEDSKAIAKAMPIWGPHHEETTS